VSSGTTQNGLFRYDGNRFERYGPDEGLPSSYISALHESADGLLWVATWTGTSKPIDVRQLRAAIAELIARLPEDRSA
jgi:ligand-binding sensor domain-containing protein